MSVGQVNRRITNLQRAKTIRAHQRDHNRFQSVDFQPKDHRLCQHFQVRILEDKKIKVI